MSTTVMRSGEMDFRRALTGLRNQAALVRALLDELDRVAPAAGKGAEARDCVVLGAQLAEEFGRLGCQLVEWVATLAHNDGSRASVETLHVSGA
jgi:hypothetical protein